MVQSSDISKCRQNIHDIIDEKPLVTTLEFTPAEMMDALDYEGKIALYGILFDFDEATLQQESSKQLQDIVSLLALNPELRLEIHGQLRIEMPAIEGRATNGRSLVIWDANLEVHPEY